MSTNRYDLSIHQNDFLRKNIRLLYVSQAAYGGDWQSMQHTHHCAELFYVVEGNGQFFLEGETYPVSVGDLIIVAPNVLHTELSLNGSTFKYIVLGIEGLELPAASGDMELPYRIVNFKGMQDTLLFYLQKILYEIEAKIPGHELICQNLMEILLILLERQTNFAVSLSPVSRKTSRLSNSIRRYIDAHYKENLSLDHLAEVSHVSKFHLAHAFTEEYGISPISYMITKRIDEGAHLLETTDYSLAQISNFCGFSSPSYFSQIFKKHHNCSPKEFRKKSRA
ncbi:MAG: helix-turn-helix domain-containing protein [Lachnospiraceae bacterium]|nr:helix-turn-helix domain-containing protein [Lachnospiraceae bacterium]